MKKVINSILVLTVVIGSFAFTTLNKKEINVTESSINWEGSKITGKTHTGSLTLQSGFIEMDGDAITGGKFVVDMTSLKSTDMEGEYAEKLIGHLKSDDFFGTTNHPTAILEIGKTKKTEEGYKVGAKLTIKDKTEPVSFILVMHDDRASAKLSFDRSKFDVKYGSGSFFDNLGDKAISDMIDLEVNLVF
ncbi:MAG: polyisoprenoid-binding protein YceI [Flavobacteriaceae bacterium]|jgi:polyisoprenoid-binding protein YceI|uniref:YceI family protein n=1 Tax=Candidatus Marifrigoribacter sp. Uisw_064 TaxID=3230970 RepID=UPI003AED212C